MDTPTNDGTAPWWQHGVVYQIYPRSFQDSNGDGVGDLRGIIARLDYLAWLGIDAVWISPFYPSPMADFGYDISDFTDVDPIFGTLRDFDELVEQARQRNIRIIVDYVPNHSSDRHPWFLQSRATRANVRRDWYVWADAKPDGAPPNNWLSVFGGRAWEWDSDAGQYYLHSFLKEQPDINWRNPDAAAAMLDVLRFWLDRGVAGFRIDAPLFVMKDPAMRDNPPNPDGAPLFHRSMGAYDSQLHLYDRGHPDVHDVFRRIRGVLDAHPSPGHKVSIGEIHVYDWKVWAGYYGQDLDEFHMPFNFGLLGIAWNAAAVRSLVEQIEAHVPPGGWPNYVLGNHDEPRIASRLGAARARVATMLLLTLRGTPTLYYGDEIGMSDVPIPAERVQDPAGRDAPELGRDPERTPMRWDGSDNAGFCPAGVEPWLPMGDDLAARNVAVMQHDRRSPLALTRALLGLRRGTPALHGGTIRTVQGGDDCFVYMREAGTERYLVVLNFADEPRQIALAQGGRGRILLSTHMDRDGEEDLASLRLRGDEGCVIRLV